MLFPGGFSLFHFVSQEVWLLSQDAFALTAHSTATPLPLSLPFPFMVLTGSCFGEELL